MTQNINHPKKPYFSQLLMHDKFEHVTTRLILTEDLNAAGALFGGRLISWVDEAAALYVMVQLKNKRIVTKKISEVIYNQPAYLGDILDFLFCVKSVGTTSITIECLVQTRSISENDPVRIILNCDLVFVRINQEGKPEAHGFAKTSD